MIVLSFGSLTALACTVSGGGGSSPRVRVGPNEVIHIIDDTRRVSRFALFSAAFSPPPSAALDGNLTMLFMLRYIAA